MLISCGGYADGHRRHATARRPNRILDFSAYAVSTGIGGEEVRAYDGRPTDAINYLALRSRQCARLSVYR